VHRVRGHTNTQIHTHRVAWLPSPAPLRNQQRQSGRGGQHRENKTKTIAGARPGRQADRDREDKSDEGKERGINAVCLTALPLPSLPPSRTPSLPNSLPHCDSQTPSDRHTQTDPPRTSHPLYIPNTRTKPGWLAGRQTCEQDGQARQRQTDRQTDRQMSGYVFLPSRQELDRARKAVSRLT